MGSILDITVKCSLCDTELGVHQDPVNTATLRIEPCLTCVNERVRVLITSRIDAVKYALGILPVEPEPIEPE
jgi:uncharacterized protein YlaI